MEDLIDSSINKIKHFEDIPNDKLFIGPMPCNMKRECCFVSPNGELYGADRKTVGGLAHMEVANLLHKRRIVELDKLHWHTSRSLDSILEENGWIKIDGDDIRRYPIERINVTEKQWDTLINYFMINYEGFCTLNQSSKKFSITSLSGMEPFQFDELCFKYI
jgi:hypothetical protein